MAEHRATELPSAGPRSSEPLWRHLVGVELRRLRQERRSTLHDVAKRAGVSPQYLSEMERGRMEPSSEMLAAVAGALDTSLLELTSAVAENLRGAQSPASDARVQSAFARAA